MNVAENENWTHYTRWDHTSFVYLTDELMQVLRNIKEDDDSRGESCHFRQLMDNVTSFMWALFMSRRSFGHLGSFKLTFGQFVSSGADSTGEVQLLEAMTKHPTNKPQAFDMSGVDVVARNQFRQTQLFVSFCEHNFRKWLEAARTEIGQESPDFQNVKEHFGTALQIHPVGEGLRDTAGDALFLFCGSATPFSKMEIVSKDAGKYVRFLSAWCPHLPICMATNMMQETPNFQGISFDRWLAGATY